MPNNTCKIEKNPSHRTPKRPKYSHLVRDFMLMDCHARRSCRSPTAYNTAPGGLRTASFGRTWGLFMLQGPADEADTSHATYTTYARESTSPA